MSAPVVMIGYFLLIPPFLGMAFCVFAIVISFGEGFSGTSTDTLSRNILIWIESMSALLGISSFVAGLLGWLLIMKKRILKCSVCGAVINAS
jgi:hypothetical protein